MSIAAGDAIGAGGSNGPDRNDRTGRAAESTTGGGSQGTNRLIDRTVEVDP